MSTLIEMFVEAKRQGKAVNFIKYLDELEKTCDYCSKPCNNAWCVTKESQDEGTDETCEQEDKGETRASEETESETSEQSS